MGAKLVRAGGLLLVSLVLLHGVEQRASRAAASCGSPQRENATKGWAADGTLLEACSCSVPCPCNFGQGPSRSYCHTIYAYRLKSARYEGVTLDGLVFG